MLQSNSAIENCESRVLDSVCDALVVSSQKSVHWKLARKSFAFCSK